MKTSEFLVIVVLMYKIDTLRREKYNLLKHFFLLCSIIIYIYLLVHKYFISLGHLARTTRVSFLLEVARSVY